MSRHVHIYQKLLYNLSIFPEESTQPFSSKIQFSPLVPRKMSSQIELLVCRSKAWAAFAKYQNPHKGGSGSKATRRNCPVSRSADGAVNPHARMDSEIVIGVAHHRTGVVAL